MCRAGEDARDAEWIAELHEYGLLRPSFIPAGEVAALRQRTRYRKKLIEARTSEGQRLSKVLEDAQLTELTEVVVVSGVPGGMRAVRFAAHDHRWDWAAGLVVFGSAARRCA